MGQSTPDPTVGPRGAGGGSGNDKLDVAGEWLCASPPQEWGFAQRVGSWGPKQVRCTSGKQGGLAEPGVC